jgi:UPF0176 protein
MVHSFIQNQFFYVMQTSVKTRKKSPVNRLSRKDLKEQMRQSRQARTTISFYKYHNLANVQEFRDELYFRLEAIDVKGRIYVADEGINGQISVPTEHVDDLRDIIYSYQWMHGIRLNVAIDDDGKSFFALIIKVRPKIVADGIDDPKFDPTNLGVHLNAEEWNAMLERDDIVLIDMRNHYESEVGHFDRAWCPEVVTFRESLPIISDLMEPQKDKSVVMYCTGGIRCEKASAYMKYKGFKNVFQLNGGIIEYTRQVNEKGLPNKFIGKNFVFDERLGERISRDVIAHCHQCGSSCDDHTNCANDHCHLLFIQCATCQEKHSGCCSQDCTDFIQLDEETRKLVGKTRVFNGTKFGKTFGKRLAAAISNSENK